MTLPLNSRLSALYETDGVQKDFSFGFRVFFDPDNGGYGLEVRRQTADGYEVIPKSDYIVMPIEDNTAGIVRFHIAPPAGQEIYLAGNTPTIQQLVLTNFGRFSAESIEDQFDFITAIIQEWLSALSEEERQRIAGDDILRSELIAQWTADNNELRDYIESLVNALVGIDILPLTDKLIKTWSGQTQEDKNKENISAQDYGAKGDSTTDDTQAFVELESVYKGKTIDLQGRTYKVTDWFSANTYVNGKFLIFGNLYSADLDVYAFTQKSHAMNFYTGDWAISGEPEIFGGSRNVFQAFCIVPMSDGLHLFVTQSANPDGTYTDYGNFLAGETYRIIEYLFKEDGSVVQPIAFSLPLNKTGHAADLGYTFDDGKLYLYTGSPNASSTDTSLGGKGFTRIEWKGAATSNVDVTVYELFDQPTVLNGNYPFMCRCAVTVDTERNIYLRGDYSGQQLVVGYRLDDLLTASNVKSVKPFIEFNMESTGNTFQGFDIHHNYMFVTTDGIGQTGSVYIYDLNGKQLTSIENIDVPKAFVSYSDYRGGLGAVINSFEIEGVYCFGNNLYIGNREYWQQIDTVVSYEGKLYAPRTSSIPVGTLPTSTGHFQEVDSVAGITPTVWSAAATYTQGAARKYSHKRITRLSSLVTDRSMAINSSNQKLVTPNITTYATTLLPVGKGWGINTWSEGLGTNRHIYYNGADDYRIYVPEVAGCTMRITSRKTSSTSYFRMRGGEASGAELVWVGMDEPTAYAGGFREYVGATQYNNRNTLATGETELRSTGGTVLTVNTSGNGDGFAQKRSGALKYAVQANSAFTWIGSRDSNALRFSTSTSDSLGTSNGFELALAGALNPLPDNSMSLGTAANRWSTVHAGTGAIQTSDERLKQQFRSQTQRERDAALEIKNSIQLFKFNDAVDLKGDGARWHVGVKAQQVISILESHDLDPFEYAFVCFDEWDEQEEILDEDGKATQEYRAAGNQYAIRYDELTMFILAAM